MEGLFFGVAEGTMTAADKETFAATWKTLSATGRVEFEPPDLALLLLCAERLNTVETHDYVATLFRETLAQPVTTGAAPRLVENLLIFSDYYLRLKQYKDCFIALENVHILAPNDKRLWTFLTVLFQAVNQHQNSLKALRQLASLGGSEPLALAIRTYSSMACLKEVDLHYGKYRHSVSQQSGEEFLLEPLEVLMLEKSQKKVIDATRNWVKQRSRDILLEKSNTHGSGIQKKCTMARKKKIGYLSGDFNDHPMGMLLLPIFANYSRDEFELVCVYTNEVIDEYTRRFASLATDFLEVSTLGTEELNEKIKRQNFDVLIDASGYTKHSRSIELHHTCAPYIFNYLGYPGPVLTKTHAGTIGDNEVFAEDVDFGEQVFKLPVCYQPYGPERWLGIDHLKLATEKKKEPLKTIVFVNLGNHLKINLPTVVLWSKVLTRYPRSILRLMVPLHARENLGKTFSSLGITQDRIVYFERMDKTRYLMTLKSSTLWLDTFPYGGHTTCADALGIGLPYVTIYGETFASRVGKSILTHAGFADWASRNEEDWMQSIDMILSDTGRSMDRLAHAKETKDFFNSKTTLVALEEFITSL